MMKVEITVRQETIPKKFQVYINDNVNNIDSKEELQSLVTQLTSEAEKALKV